MTIGEMIKLKPGDTFKRLGVTQTVKSVRIVPHYHDVGINKAGQPETIDLSFLEMLHSGGSLYSGPPVRANLELREYSAASLAS